MIRTLKIWMVGAFVALVVLLPRVAGAQQGTITFYFYDDDGRLTSVVKPTGEVAIYQYDPAGNLLAISRTPTESAISDFSPTSGPVGALVAITGNGFGSTVRDNHALFNGLPGEIVSASPTQIVAKVPEGAGSGPITVVMPTSAATSSASFTVQVPSSGPTITGFAPTIGTPGTAVSISGTNFEPTAINNQVSINVTTANVTAASDTTLATNVPTGAGSGHIRVTTPSGTATSSADFFIPPPFRTANDVSFTGRMAIGETKRVAMNISGKIAMVLFDGTAGQRVSLLVGNSTLSGSVSLLSTSGGSLGSAFLSSGSFIDAKTLPITGTYTILVSPFFGSTGSVAFTLYDVSTDATGTITPGGPSVGTSVIPGQNVALTFNGSADEMISILASALPRNTTLTLFDPSGRVIASDAQTNSFVDITLFIDVQRLPVTGVYKIVIDPGGLVVGNITCTVFDVPPDVTGNISLDGAPANVVIAVPGQNANLTFSGVAGQQLLFTSTPSGLSMQVTFLKPDLTVLIPGQGGFSDRQVIEPIVLPVSGIYTIVLDPSREGVGNVSCSLYDVPADVIGTITPGGPPVSVTTAFPGQNAQLTFNSAVGQRFSAFVRFASTQPNARFSLRITALQSGSPGGPVTLVETGGISGEGFVDTFGLPSGTGIFKIFLNPLDVVTGTFTVTLFDVPPDVTGTITPGGPPVVATTTVPGQNAKLTFDGVAGQKVSLAAAGTTGLVGEVRIEVGGGFLSGGILTDPSQELFVDTVSLPVTGTYTIGIDPDGMSTGSKTFTLFNVVDVTGVIDVGGPPVTVNLTTPGQNAELHFTTTDQPVTIHVTNNSISCVTVELLGPDGDGFTGVFSCDGSASFDLDTLDLFAGTYTVRVNPDGAATGSVTITVTSP